MATRTADEYVFMRKDRYTISANRRQAALSSIWLGCVTKTLAIGCCIVCIIARRLNTYEVLAPVPDSRRHRPRAHRLAGDAPSSTAFARDRRHTSHFIARPEGNRPGE